MNVYCCMRVHEDLRDAWECMNMHEIVWEWLIFTGWVGHSMLSCTMRHAWSWMGLHENGWAWLRMSHIHWWVWAIPCWFTFYDMHENEWEFIRLSHTWWTCMWWYGMTMHENVWWWLMFKVCVGRLRLSRILRHAWWMCQNGSLRESTTYPRDVRVAQNWFTCDGSHNMTHAPITPLHSYDDTPIHL